MKIKTYPNPEHSVAMHLDTFYGCKRDVILVLSWIKHSTSLQKVTLSKLASTLQYCKSYEWGKKSEISPQSVDY